MRIDLHTHSRISDGTQTPAELMRDASSEGLDVVALTDHDTSAGWAEAAEAAAREGITLVRGMEISTKFRGRGVHLLGYLPDPEYPPLVEGLQRIIDGRNARVPAIIERLKSLDIDIEAEEIARLAGNPKATGRPHVADALIHRNIVKDRDEAFRKFLNHGGGAYVERYAPPLEEMIRVVTAAGGVAVLAHPWGRNARADMTADDIKMLAEVGLVGLEVDHQDHDADARRELAEIAENLGLIRTGSSDHHGVGKKDHGLGCNTTDPDEFARLVACAATSAAAAQRPAPTVLYP